MGMLPILPRLPNGDLDGEKICPPCTRCCRYVSVGIEPPTTVDRVSKALWLLYHRSISVYLDWEGDWYMVVPTECENLRADGLCGIYEERPLLCRDYELDACEGTNEEATERARFDDVASFLKWLAREWPALYKKCLERSVVPPAIRARVARG